MKKLYAKTSFSTKNRKAGKNENDPNAAADSFIKCHDPILAFQPTKCKDLGGDSANKYKPKHPFGAKLQNLEHLRNPQFSSVENSSLIMPVSPHSPYEESPYYYTITELENLQMLDHRHPHFHHHQKMQQMHGHKVYHQHNQLVLQLPIVTSTTNTEEDNDHDTIDSPSSQQQRLITSPHQQHQPIYEAPQMNSTASSSGSSSLLSRSSSNLSSPTATIKSSMGLRRQTSLSATTPPPPPHHQHQQQYYDYYDSIHHPQMSRCSYHLHPAQ
ncbi:protein enabled-like [Musca vetustissima]|uniref:protein enabled-like n=1 Tax=Musca vetustissima TaxID=27455 RepID=UPI002AB75097|nr:protein enabled-like [Musca vetustissima]